MAVGYIRDNPDEFMATIQVGDDEDPHLPRTHPEYCDYMSQDGVWAGAMEIIALSRLLEARFHIHRHDGRIQVLVDESRSGDQE